MPQISYDQALIIRARAAAGETQVSLSREFGVTPQAVSMICTNRSHTSPWPHTPESIARNRKSRKLREAFGIDADEWDRMLTAAGHACEVCRGSASLVVDHDHQTGAVRGVLCQHCNKALGFVRDDPNTLRGLIAYLDKHGKAY